MAKISQIKLGSTTYDIGAAWGNITGKPSSFTPSSHTHSYITYTDTRSDNQSPDDVQAGLTVHLKANGTDGISDGGSYHAILNVKDWGDYSGGPYWQSTVTANNNMYFRRSTAGTTWGSWQKVLSDNNYTDYTVTKTGSGASGTWGISITGNAATATKATQDGAGNTITSKYVTVDTTQTISGTKTMTGGLNVSGRSAGGGDDEGIVVGFANNGYAGLCLGGAASARSVFYFKSDGTKPFWRYNNGSASYDIHHPSKSGTIALTNDLSNYLPLSGGTLSGLLSAHGGISLNASTAQAVGAPEYILGIKAFAEGGNVIWQSKGSVSVGYADSAGIANSAKLLHLNHGSKSSTASTSMSSWTGAVSGLKYVWGQSFFDSSIGTDSGDLVLGLRPGEYSSGGTELNMMIDGDYYSMGNKVLHAGNYTHYAPTKTGTGASGTWGINITGSAGSVAWANITGKPSAFNPDLPLRLQNYSTSGFADANSATEQGFHYITAKTNGPSFKGTTSSDYRILTTAYSSSWLQQFATDFRNNEIYYRRRENSTWKPWIELLTSDLVLNNTTVGASGWTNTTTANRQIVNHNTLAYWNGAHAGTNSNLAYCKLGAFGTMATQNTGSYYTATEADSRYAKLASPNNLIHSSNEITMVPDAYSGDVYLNYRTASGSTNGAINTYRFCKGNGGDLASITASSFIGSLNGNASTATKLQSSRTIKIGESAQNFDGSANLTYTPFGMRLTQAHYGAYSSMNAIADTGNALGMANLTSGNSTIDPNGGTGWHHYINMTWSDTTQNNGSATNEWCTQIANPCGSTDLWVRSRSGGSIANGTAWGAPWTRILTGSNYTNVLDGRYVNTAGDTMTGALNFANGTWNNVGDDCAMGDCNQAGVIGIKGLNGATGIYFTPYSGSVAQKITIDGAGTMSITGKVSAETLQTIANGVTSTIGSQNNGWLHYSTNSPSGHWFNQNVSVQGNIYAGSSYNKLVLTEENYTNYAPTKTGGGASGTWGINITGSAGSTNYLNINNTANLSNGLQYIQSSGQTSGNDLPSSTWWHVIKMNHGQGDTYYKRLLAFDFWNDNIMTSGAAGDGSVRSWKQVWVQGNSVTGAVWNDYAECRESDCEEFGYVLMEVGDDSLTKTTERLSHFAGVSSDTWGFSQGETDKAKTPIAVAGRVLVYPYQDRNNYKPGDCVCAAPGGTVDIMTREEVREWPDRIVGTVSCVPNYEEWGGGEGADRDPVKVNGRIWIKVK